MKPKHVYRNRFPENSFQSRKQIWRDLCTAAFEKYIFPGDTVMDIGAGYCEFINAVHCAKKIAVDINQDTKTYAARGVQVLLTRADRIPKSYNHTIDKVFLSNVLEHLEKKEEVLAVLVRIKKLLAPGGKLIIMQPNIDLVREKYWNFFDHIIILNTESIREILALTGYHVDTFIVRFLPYTTVNNRLPVNLFLIRLYLFLPEFLRPFAGQSLIIASP